MPIKKIKQLIADDKIGEALDIFDNITNGLELNYTIISLKGTFSEIKQKAITGIVSEQEQSLQKSKLRNSIIESLKEFEKTSPTLSNSPDLLSAMNELNSTLKEAMKVFQSNNVGESISKFSTFLESIPKFQKEYSQIEPKIQKLNEPSLEYGFSKKDVNQLTKGVKKASKILSFELKKFQKTIVSNAVNFSRESLKKDLKEQIGLIYQASGTGITRSLLAFITTILSNSDFSEHRIIILCDRIDVQNRLKLAILQAELTQDEIVSPETKIELAGTLANSNKRIIVTTLQKLKKEEKYFSKDIVIGFQISHNRFKVTELFPNAIFLLFATTPTNEIDPKFQLLSNFNLKSAIGEKLVSPVHFEFRRAEINISDLNSLKEHKLLNTRSQIFTTAKDIINHFKQRRNNGHGKAIITVPNIAISELYYQTILRLEPEWKSKGIVELISSKKSKEENNHLAYNFADEQHPFSLAITVDMWLTSIDVPILDTLYLIRPFSGPKLFHAIGRINRLHSKKEHALIVDYFGQNWDHIA